MPEEMNTVIETATESVKDTKLETIIGLAVVTFTAIGIFSTGKKIADGGKKKLGKYIEVKDNVPEEKETEVKAD